MSANKLAKTTAVVEASGYVGIQVVNASLELGGFEFRILVRALSVCSSVTLI